MRVAQYSALAQQWLADREPAPVAQLNSLTGTQKGDLQESNIRCRTTGHNMAAMLQEAFLRGVASERDRAERDRGSVDDGRKKTG
jgi:hypothetical protein